ncbi:hypothetical protein SLS57_004942 [Botryosphaeria dothidea]
MSSFSRSSTPPLTLPPPTKEHIVLKIYIESRRPVYRLIVVPENYTFQLLHKLIQYSVGWADASWREHRFIVHGPAEKYKSYPKKDTDM